MGLSPATTAQLGLCHGACSVAATYKPPILVPGFDSLRAHMPCSFGSTRHWWGGKSGAKGRMEMAKVSIRWRELFPALVCREIWCAYALGRKCLKGFWCRFGGQENETREIRTSDLESDALPLRHSPLQGQWKRLDLQMAKKAGGIWRQKCQGFTGRLVRKRRFREEKHGPHRLVVRMSRCGRSNLGLNPSVGILEQAWNCLAKAASLLQGCGHEDLRDTVK